MHFKPDVGSSPPPFKRVVMWTPALGRILKRKNRKLDLEEIEENIKHYSNEKLIVEGIIKISDYLPEVQELLNKEIESRHISQEEINQIIDKNKKDTNLKKQKKQNKLKGLFLFINIILFIDFFIYLLAGFFAIRNVGLLVSLLSFIISIVCLICFVLILCKKKNVKKVFIFFMSICILISIINILISLLNNSIGAIGKDLFLILKNSLFIIYFAKSNYVNEYLIK